MSDTKPPTSVESRCDRWDGTPPALRETVSFRLFRPLLLLAGSCGLVAVLYWARALLIPIALAVLLTFLLTPMVAWLERSLGRVAAVLLVVLVVVGFTGGAVWLLTLQAARLTDEIPRYRDNLKQKIADVRGASKGGALERVQSAAQEVTDELKKDAPVTRSAPKPVPVVIRSEPAGLWQLPSLLDGLGAVAVVIVLVIFMLLEREDLRNRIIRLVGYGRLTTTTRALDEAAQRISRYLLMQTVINAVFGLVIGMGLLLIGLPYALLWGALAGALRFIPYAGPWAAGALITVFSLAVFPGWLFSLLVVGLFVVSELMSALVMEPLLYAQSAGVSQVALLVTVGFWTWLWGPIGLLLATPLTVCIVVLGKYVPELEFVTVLMSDQPVIEPHVAFYQRLLALDPDEAGDIAERHQKGHSLTATFDEVIVPAMHLAKRDRQQDRFPERDFGVVLQATREIVSDLVAEVAPEAASEADEPARASSDGVRLLKVLGSPARDEADELALEMLRHLLDSRRWHVDITSPHVLASELVALVETREPDVVCVGAVSRGGAASHTRYLCKRLRSRFPDLQIVVGRWGSQDDIEDARQLIHAAGADDVGFTLGETKDQLEQRGHLDRPSGREEGASASPGAARADRIAAKARTEGLSPIA